MALKLLSLAALAYLGTPTAASASDISSRGLVAVRADIPDFRLGDLLNPVVGFLECAKGDATVQLLCKLLSNRVNTALAAAHITVDRSGILFSYNDGTHKDLDTGHSCTVTAEITGSSASAKLLASATLNFAGNPISLSNPALFVAELPVELSARTDIKERFGQRLLGSCVNLGSDSFHASGSLSTKARLAVLFTFAPSLRLDPSGNYILTIKPITKVAAQLIDTNINLDISGISPFNGLATALLGGTSSIFKAITHILKGDSLSEVWNDVLHHVIDVTAGAILSIPFDQLDNLVEMLAQLYIDEKKNGIAQQYSGELEKSFRALVAKTLGLDANGERQFVIRKDFVDLVNRLGEGADIWLPDKPAGYCASDAECSDGKYCTGIEKCVNERCVAGSKPCIGSDEKCNESRKTFTDPA
ncbi:hypothetical protein B0H63DRAFT_502139 [Podospora didyma]|uniref:Uncharacterized protein n=1 Tax=Podospora didyma TaxID=330526 RepID=A0AAE0NHT5_9PEZI|nr:hypothetical protein B0H63DRAFT_502139 [Podospora didyma]